jgi:1-deoxy-D-xylulose-5-phosphate synthase
VLRRGGDIAFLAVGTMVLEALDAAAELSARGIEATVVNCRFLKPHDRAVLEEVVQKHTRIITLEEGAVVNGFGAFIAREIEAIDVGHPVKIRFMGLPDHFIQHGGRAELLREIDLDVQGIVANTRRFMGQAVSSVADTA